MPSRQNTCQKQGIPISPQDKISSHPSRELLKIKFSFYCNDLLKPLAPRWVRLRFIPFLCNLAIIWLITVTQAPAEEWRTWFSFPLMVFGGVEWDDPWGPSQPILWLYELDVPLHTPLSSPLPCPRIFLLQNLPHPRQVWAAWSTLQSRPSAKVQQILILYLQKETGIICVLGLGFWWWHEEAIQDVWPSKCTAMHTSHLFSE